MAWANDQHRRCMRVIAIEIDPCKVVIAVGTPASRSRSRRRSTPRTTRCSTIGNSAVSNSLVIDPALPSSSTRRAVSGAIDRQARSSASRARRCRWSRRLPAATAPTSWPRRVARACAPPLLRAAPSRWPDIRGRSRVAQAHVARDAAGPVDSTPDVFVLSTDARALGQRVGLITGSPIADHGRRSQVRAQSKLVDQATGRELAAPASSTAHPAVRSPPLRGQRLQSAVCRVPSVDAPISGSSGTMC